MKRKLKAIFVKLFRPSAHSMERRMKKGYRAAASVNLEEAELSIDPAGLAEYEKWLLTQTDKQ